MDEIPRRVHFVGIGGVGMSGLAQHLHNLGYLISGSDRVSSERTDALSKLGIDIHVGHRAENIANASLVVRTSAVHDDNVEVVEAHSRCIPVILREQLLGTIFNSFDTRIAICGTHGKTTVTALIHEILAQAGVEHTAFIGGVYQGNNYYFGRDIVVAEACEFNRSFYNLYPTICVCLNAEYDHPDCYRSKQDVHDAFAHFMDNVECGGTVVLPYELRKLCRGRRLYFDRQFDVSNVATNDGKPRFDLTLKGETCTMELGVVGKHNVNNALAAIAVTHQLLNVPLQYVQQGLHAFTGVDRRWTEVKSNLCKVVVDYAHHPTEIACSVATAQTIAGSGKVICVFQPHTYSRTRAFFDQFATCFDGAHAVAYLPIYSAREQPIAGVNSYALTERAKELGVNAHFLPDFASAKSWLDNTLSQDDVLLILGAGDICELANLL